MDAQKEPSQRGEETHLSSYVMLEAAEERESSNEPVLVGLDTPTRLGNDTDAAQSAWVLINDAASSVSSQGTNTAESPQPPAEVNAKDGDKHQEPLSAPQQVAASLEEQRQREEEQGKVAAAEAERARVRAEELSAAAERAERLQRRSELERRALEEQRIHQERLAAEKAARVQAQQNEERRRREEEARAVSVRCQRERNNFLTSEDELRRSLAAAEAAELKDLAARNLADRQALAETARRAEAEAQERQRRAFEPSNDTIQRMAREIADSEEERERQEAEAAARAADIESQRRLVERDAAYAATLLPRSSPTGRLQAPEPLLPEPAIPTRRRCDCLGASSGIHRRDCPQQGA